MVLNIAVQSRRRILEKAAVLTGSCLFIPVTHGREHTDAFDSLPQTAWRNARRNGLVMVHRPAPTQLSDRTQIVPDGEPGRPLVVHGQVFAPDGSTPAHDITVYAYNTDSAGYYGSEQKEYPPRLFGWMRTTAAGRFELDTIYPGHYPGMHVPAHVHFTLWGAGYPPQWAEELRFEGDPYITPDMRAQAAAQGQFCSIQKVTEAKNGVLQCRYSIRLSKETNFR